MAKYPDIRKKVLLSCVDDYTGLWEIIREVDEAFSNIDTEERQNCCLEIIHDLLAEGLIQAGDFDGLNFESWKLTHQEVVQRIRLEWEAFDGEPGISDIVTFVATPLGDQKLLELN